MCLDLYWKKQRMKTHCSKNWHHSIYRQIKRIWQICNTGKIRGGGSGQYRGPQVPLLTNGGRRRWGRRRRPRAPMNSLSGASRRGRRCLGDGCRGSDPMGAPRGTPPLARWTRSMKGARRFSLRPFDVFMDDVVDLRSWRFFFFEIGRIRISVVFSMGRIRLTYLNVDTLISLHFGDVEKKYVKKVSSYVISYKLQFKNCFSDHNKGKYVYRTSLDIYVFF